jgi:hypothetical protein
MTRYAYTDPKTREYAESNEKPAMTLCDFCGTAEIHHIFHTPRHATPVPGVVSTEGWAACRVCEGMVRRQEWKALIEYAARELCRRHPRLRQMGLAWVRGQAGRMIGSFRENYREGV